MKMSCKSYCHSQMNKTILIFISLILLTSLSSCEQEKLNDDILLAEVGNNKLRISDVKSALSPELYYSDSLRIINQYKNNWVNRQLKVREARRLGLDQHPEVKKRLQQVTESILVDAINEAVLLENPTSPVSLEEAQIYYENNKEKFILTERHVRYRHLIAATASDAQNARTALMRGRSWHSIAEQYAIAPQQAIQISQQYYPLSTAASQFPAMNSFLQVIGISEISPVRRIDDQYHFVQLIESRDAGEHPQVDWIIQKITEWLATERKRKHLRAMEQRLFLQAEANNELKIHDVITTNPYSEHRTVNN